MFVVDTCRKVLLFMLVPWSESWSAFWITRFGFFTMSCVTCAGADRNCVGIDRLSSEKTDATELKSLLAIAT